MIVSFLFKKTLHKCQKSIELTNNIWYIIYVIKRDY